jgi:hypothetical protein
MSQLKGVSLLKTKDHNFFFVSLLLGKSHHHHPAPQKCTNPPSCVYLIYQFFQLWICTVRWLDIVSSEISSLPHAGAVYLGNNSRTSYQVTRFMKSIHSGYLFSSTQIFTTRSKLLNKRDMKPVLIVIAQKFVNILWMKKVSGTNLYLKYKLDRPESFLFA